MVIDREDLLKSENKKTNAVKQHLVCVCLAALSFRDFLNINAGKMEMWHYKYESNWTYTNESINMVSIQADLSHSILLHEFTVFFQCEKTAC